MQFGLDRTVNGCKESAFRKTVVNRIVINAEFPSHEVVCILE